MKTKAQTEEKRTMEQYVTACRLEIVDAVLAAPEKFHKFALPQAISEALADVGVDPDTMHCIGNFIGRKADEIERNKLAG